MMLQRCMNPQHVSYNTYGGRGIQVFAEWVPTDNTPYADRTYETAFSNFVRDVGLKPSPYHTLDRGDANWHYFPHNVSWQTKLHQARNKRDTVMVPDPTHPADSFLPAPMISAAEAAEKLGIPYMRYRAQLIRQGKWGFHQE